jgi:hypothetical protein
MLRSALIVPFVDAAFTADGEAADPATAVSLQITLDDLAWRATALHTARAAGELVSGKIRARMSAAAPR